MDFFLFQAAAIERLVEAAGLVIEEVVERGPYTPEVEYQSQRAYFFCAEAGSPLKLDGRGELAIRQLAKKTERGIHPALPNYI
jgi:hypothetical protein